MDSELNSSSDLQSDDVTFNSYSSDTLYNESYDELSDLSEENFDKKIDKLIIDLKDVLKSIDNNSSDELNESVKKSLRKKASKLSPLINDLRKRIKNNGEIKKQSNRLGNGKIGHCYICKINLWQESLRHSFYRDMCLMCGSRNLIKRDVKKDMTDKIAIVTGGRVKIGFETAIRLLRNGCKVLVTSRFVDDCLERYQADPDFDKFKDNLYIYQLNMLDGQNIEKFIIFVHQTFPRIDILINNAAQTIKRPVEFFNHLIEKYNDTEHITNIVHRDHKELRLLNQFGQSQQLLEYHCLDLIDSNDSKFFPKGELDVFGQQIDLRNINSWVLEAEDVSLQELAEVYIINSIGPYILSTKLKPLLTKSDNSESKYSWIINVTSMEGVFDWNFKPSRHPHTNMAKSALNMFTRTCGQHFIKSNIVMCCVDTGWNNPQYPNSYEVKTPVDCVDGASRILDIVYREITSHSVLFKDFEIHPW